MASLTYDVKTGPFVFSIETNIAALQGYIEHHYQGSILEPGVDRYIDYFIKLNHGPFWRRLFSPQACFYFNERSPFNPLPLSQAHAMLEWGMNWVLSSTAHQFLIIHSAVLEKDGKAVIISAPPGSGKSTLCAYLASTGWRLLSDELSLICPETLQVYGLSRPINLKNKSISLMKSYFSSESFSDVAKDTHKGSVCLVKPPQQAVLDVDKPAQPSLCLFVAYTPGEACHMEPVNKCKALTEIIRNSFNFSVLGYKGFATARSLAKQTQSFYLEYSEFHAAEQAILRELESTCS